MKGTVKCPIHIENNVEKLSSDNKFFEYECDEYHLSYLVKCKCGCEEFEVLINTEPLVLAICTKCEESVTVYNLRYYPAATLLPDDRETKYTSPEGDTIFNLCVVYEYPELEESEEFNQNDITWCEIYGFGVNSKKSFLIINDETA